jgi:hypothetical protein
LITGHKWRLGDNTGGIDLEQAEYTAELYVFSDDCKDTGVSVLEYMQSVNIFFGTHYKVGNDEVEKAFVRSIAPPRLVEGSTWTWLVRLTYVNDGGEGGDSGGGGGTSKPWDDPPELSTHTVGRSEVVQKAIYYGGFTADGFTPNETIALTNSAKLPYSPAPEKEVFNRLVRVTRNFQSVTIDDTKMPTEWVNEKQVLLFDIKLLQRIPIKPRCLRCIGWSTEPVHNSFGDYVKVTFEGEIKHDTWDHFLLDKGKFVDACNKPDARGYVTSSRPAGTAGVRRNVDAFGYPVDSLLNGAGDPLPECSDDRFFGQWGYERPVDIKTLDFFKDITQ